MKRIASCIWVGLFLLVLGACVVIERPRRDRSAVGYRFESDPRAVLAKSAIIKSRDPKLAVRASGALYMLGVYETEGRSRLGLFISHDGGDRFAPPVPISDSAADVSSHGENSPSLAFGATEIYALWEQARADGNTDLMFSRSLNFGRDFQKPIRVTDQPTPTGNSFSYLAVAPNGHLYAVWLDARDLKLGPPGTSAVYLAKSSDRGATFGKNVRAATGACPCCRPNLAFGRNSEVFISWRKVFEGSIRDIVVAASKDGGEAFQAPVRVSVDNWKIEGCPHSGPALLQKANRLYVAWYTEGDRQDGGIRCSWSEDGGKSFTQPVNVSRNILDPNHPAMSISADGSPILVFQGRDARERNGWGPLRAYLVETGEEGKFSDPLPALGNRQSISYPALAAGISTQVFLAWTEVDEKGQSQIVLSRGRRL